MRQVYSVSLFQETAVSSIVAPQQLTPGAIWVIRDVDIWFSEDAAGASCSVAGFATQTFAWASYDDLLASGPSQAYHWSGRVVIPYLGTFQVAPSPGPLGHIDVTVCGYLLTDP